MTDDLPPTGEEADAQRREGVTPLFWTALGLGAVLVFAAALYLGREPHGAPHAVVVPAEAPATD